MRFRLLATAVTAAALATTSVGPVLADAPKPGQSMTHMKTAAGLAATLESAGVVIYVQGGATASVIGDSISAANGQIVFHIPVTGTKTGVQHQGSNIVFFNTANNQQVQLRNPVIDLAKGVVTATIPQADNQTISVLTIGNASGLKPKVNNDRKTKIRTSAYSGAALNLSPGVAATLASLLGLPSGSLPDGLAFGTADVSLKKSSAKR
jgi:hypothetical protein